jgi:hypothetical protein
VLQFGKGEAAFPGVLAAALRNPAVPARFHAVLLENLMEECGEGDIRRSHVSLLETCLDSIGVDTRNYLSVPPTAGTDAYLSLLGRAGEHSNPLHLFSVFAIEEVSNVGEFTRMLELLEARGFSGQELEYVKRHIEVDVSHVDSLLGAVGELCEYDIANPVVQLALREYEMVTDWFYDSLGRRPEPC